MTSTQVCPRCGAAVKGDERFCRECGEPIVQRTVAMTREQMLAQEREMQQQAPVVPPPASPPPAAPPGDVQRTVAMSRDQLRAPEGEQAPPQGTPVQPQEGEVLQRTVAMSRDQLRPPPQAEEPAAPPRAAAPPPQAPPPTEVERTMAIPRESFRAPSPPPEQPAAPPRFGASAPPPPSEAERTAAIPRDAFRGQPEAAGPTMPQRETFRPPPMQGETRVGTAMPPRPPQPGSADRMLGFPDMPAPAAITSYAGVGRRFLALLIDGVIFGILFFLMAALFGNTGGGSANLSGLPFLIYLVVLLGYYVVMESQMGGTVGKLALGIRVVNEDGSPVTLQGSLIRNLLRVVDGLFFYLVGAILIWTSPKKQRLGDRVAKTVVVPASEVPTRFGRAA